jgi:peptide/nickel transport system permease protein
LTVKEYTMRFMRDKAAILGVAIFGLCIAVAVLAPLIASQDPYDLSHLSVLDSRLRPGQEGSSGVRFWLGTDEQGRDLLSAIFYGLRVSLVVALVSTCIALVIGAAAGLLAAYVGGRADALLMRLVDLQLAFPSILIALVLLAVLGTGLGKVITAIVCVQWAYYARVVRSAALAEMNKEYIQAARTLGLPVSRILLRHLLPNSVAALAVVAVVEMGSAIALEATLSFLGVGLPITEPSLGLLISNGYSFLLTGEYWLSFFPGLVLLVLLISINLIGERLRRMNDPTEL